MHDAMATITSTFSFPRGSPLKKVLKDGQKVCIVWELLPLLVLSIADFCELLCDFWARAQHMQIMLHILNTYIKCSNTLTAPFKAYRKDSVQMMCLWCAIIPLLSFKGRHFWSYIRAYPPMKQKHCDSAKCWLHSLPIAMLLIFLCFWIFMFLKIFEILLLSVFLKDRLQS